MTNYQHTSHVQSNTKLLNGRSPRSLGRTDYRQAQRRYMALDEMDQLARRFAGMGSGGNRQWPLNFPRKVRRQIARDVAKRKWQEGTRVIL